jgi:hypothetical protein
MAELGQKRLIDKLPTLAARPLRPESGPSRIKRRIVMIYSITSSAL